MSHKYQVGQQVQHFDNKEEGVIVGLKLSEQVDDSMDPGEPWYEIDWINTDFIGQEHEISLILIHQ